MSAPPEPTKLKSLLTDALIVALGTASVYLVTFFYEWGYCSHFEIPSNLINPNTTTVLVAAGAIGTFFLLSMQLFGFAVPLIRAGTNPTDKQRPYREVFLVNALLLILAVVLLRAYGFGWPGALLFLGFAAFLNAIYFGIGLVVHREKGSIASRLEAISAKRGKDAFDPWALVEEGIGRVGVLSFVAFIAMLGIAFVVGNGEAARQQRFLALADSPNFVVLRIYGDLVIAGEIDRAASVVGPDLLLVRLSNEKALRLSASLSGPLSSKALVKQASDKSNTSPGTGASAASAASSRGAGKPAANASNASP